MPKCIQCGLETASPPDGGNRCASCRAFSSENTVAYRCDVCGGVRTEDTGGGKGCATCGPGAGSSRVRFMVPVLIDGPAGPGSKAVEDPDETVRKRCDSIAASVSDMRKKLDDVEHFAESARKNCAGTGHAQVARCGVDDMPPHIIRLKDDIHALDEVFEGREWDLENCGPGDGCS